MKFDHMEPKPLLDEVRAAIKQLKSGKSPGLDGIPAELLKYTEARQELRPFFIYVPRSGRLANGQKNGSCRNL